MAIPDDERHTVIARAGEYMLRARGSGRNAVVEVPEPFVDSSLGAGKALELHRLPGASIRGNAEIGSRRRGGERFGGRKAVALVAADVAVTKLQGAVVAGSGNSRSGVFQDGTAKKIDPVHVRAAELNAVTAVVAEFALLERQPVTSPVGAETVAAVAGVSGGRVVVGCVLERALVEVMMRHAARLALQLRAHWAQSRMVL